MTSPAFVIVVLPSMIVQNELVVTAKAIEGIGCARAHEEETSASPQQADQIGRDGRQPASQPTPSVDRSRLCEQQARAGAQRRSGRQPHLEATPYH